ncbi:hypothetical protein ACFSUD_11220 [Sulfitobacter aestuarii]|uniref:Uncharacterized protein n=1 Tax=Sulfitobacter aestuarii TaxID=2161676 RepID=A0ABW5U388_9RHOB
MMESRDMQAKAEALQRLLQERLGIKARNLRQGFRQARRHLPRPVRRQARMLGEAEQLVGHPRIARQLDPAVMENAFASVRSHLRGIDAGDLRKARILAVAGSIAWKLLLLAGVFVTFLWWRGYV